MKGKTVTLKDRFEADKIQAMKDAHAAKHSKSLQAGEHLAEAEARLAAIRAMLTKFSQLEAAGNVRRDLTDQDMISAVRSGVAARRDAERIFREAGDTDRADREAREATVLDSYLPSLLDEAATRELVLNVIEANSLSGMQAIGRVMATFKDRTDVDKGLASKLAKELLS